MFCDDSANNNIGITQGDEQSRSTVLNTVATDKAGLKEGEESHVTEPMNYRRHRDTRHRADLKALAKFEGTELESLYEEQDWLETDSSKREPSQ